MARPTPLRAARWLAALALALPSLASAQTVYHLVQSTGTLVGTTDATNLPAANATTQTDFQWRTLTGAAVGGTSAQIRTAVTGTAFASIARVYAASTYATGTTVSAPTATLWLRSTSTSDQYQAYIKDYDPNGASGNGVTLYTSAVVNSPNTGAATAAAFTFSGTPTVIPAGHRLMLEVFFKPATSGNTGRIYLNATANDSTFTVTEAAGSAPGAPGTPAFSSTTSSGTTATWTSGSGATSHNLQRATDSGFTAGLTTFTGVTSPYADAGPLTGNTTYWYRAVAVNANGSTTGTGASVLTQPAAPAAPSFSALAQTSLSVSWTAPTGGASSYNVQRAADSGFTTGLVTSTGVTSPFSSTGLTAGTTYWYRVQAVNTSGTMNGTGASTATLPNAPGTPGTPTYSGTTASATTVTWTAASGATSYDLQRASDSGFTTGLQTFAGVTSPYTDSTLASSSTYWYRVVATNAGGSTTGTGSSVTTAAGPPGTPGTPTYSSIAQTSLVVSWTSGSGATSHNLQRAADAGFTSPTTFTGVTSPYTDAGPLTANTTYWYRAVAVNAQGSTTGTGASVTTLPPAPGTPGTPTFSNLGSGSVTVSWTSGANAASHNLQRAADSGFTTGLTTFVGATSPYGDTGLSASTTYWYRAVAVNASGSATGTGASTTTTAGASLTVAAGTQPAAANVAAATAGTIVFRVALTASAGTVTLTSLALGNGGTATTDDVSAVQLYDDAAGTLVAAGAWTGTRWLFKNLSYAVTGTKTLRAVLSLAGGATAGRTFTASLANGDVAAASPATVTAFTGFSGNAFTVTAGATEGDPTANSTAPVLRILNPADGATVSLTPAAPAPAPNGAFRVQVYVYNPGGVAALTSVKLSTDNGATWPLTLARNTNYFTGDLYRGVWELAVTTLATGSYTLRAQAINTVPKTVVSGPAVIAINPARRGDGNLLRRDNSSQLCTDCHAIATHSSENTSSKYGSWMVNCLDCHTPHNTTNVFLVRKSITPPAVNGHQGAKAVKFSTTTGDSNSSAVASASFANSDNSGPCQVCHTRTSNTAGTVARWRNTGNADTHYTVGSGTGTQSCTGCHSHTNGFKGGESTGGVACASCHSTIWTLMHGSDGVGTGSATHKHSLVGATDTAADPGVDWSAQTQLSAVLAANRTCTGMCHSDHPHTLTSPAVATHDYNLYLDPSTTASRNASTSTSATRARTDFDPATNGGLCATCHQKPILTTGGTGITVTAASFGASAHDYLVNTVTSTYTWKYDYGATHGSTDRNCTKCHSSRTEGNTPTVANASSVSAVHGTSDPSLLAGSSNPAGAAAGYVCYNCHGSTPSPADGAQGNRSGRDIQTQIVHATTAGQSGHPANSDSVHSATTEAAAAWGNTLGLPAATARHANCLDCHDPHEARHAGRTYRSGTATVAANGTAVTGTGTNWNSHYVGASFRLNAWTAGKWVAVTAVGSTTSLTLAAHTDAAGTNAAYTLSIPSNLAGPPLQGAWGAALTTNPAFWTATTSTNFTKKVLAVGTDTEASLCFKCHSTFYWGTGAPPVAPSGFTYATGTATAANAGTAVTGSGTSWTTSYVGAAIKNNTLGVWHTVTAVASATSLTITPAATAAWTGAYTIQMRETDVAMEFNPANAGNWATAGTANSWSTGETAGSFHPVLATAAGNLGQVTLANLVTTNFPWSTTARNTMTCSDCHESDQVTDPNGPHGSAAKFILKGPGTAWDSTIQLANASPYMAATVFCANCHSTAFTSSRTTAHSNGQHTGTRGVCMQCHVAIPHGSMRPGLLSARCATTASPGGILATDQGPYQQGPACVSGSSGLYIASYPANSTTAWSTTTYCGCGGTGH